MECEDKSGGELQTTELNPLMVGCMMSNMQTVCIQVGKDTPFKPASLTPELQTDHRHLDGKNHWRQ